MSAQPTATGVVPVVIVGAGPGGLVLARRLRKAGVEFMLIDRGRTAASWLAMSPTMRLVSPWWTNVLDVTGLFHHAPFAMVSAPEYAAYLEEYRSRHAIAVREHVAVHRLRDAAHGFTLDTSAGEIHARQVVCATGYFSNPRGPEPGFDDDGSIPLVHVGDLRGDTALAALAGGGRRVLIVGKRISAGQLMIDLHDQQWQVALSCRQPVTFRRGGWLGALKDAIYYFYEELLVTFRPDLNSPSFPPMDGGRSEELVRSGAVAVHMPLRSIANGVATFTDGTSGRFDVVLLATGYRPALDWLEPVAARDDDEGLPVGNRWEVTGRPGLYCFGFANRPNYRSRTIRGVRREARTLASVISARLADAHPPVP